jgi:hypothetical protein
VTTVTNDAAATGDLVGVSADEEFWNLVCADDDWLRAEFEAIVSSGFADRPARARPSGSSAVGRPGESGPSWWEPGHPRGLGPPFRVARQRSPPT